MDILVPRWFHVWYANSSVRSMQAIKGLCYPVWGGIRPDIYSEQQPGFLSMVIGTTQYQDSLACHETHVMPLVEQMISQWRWNAISNDVLLAFLMNHIKVLFKIFYSHRNHDYKGWGFAMHILMILEKFDSVIMGLHVNLTPFSFLSNNQCEIDKLWHTLTPVSDIP